MSNVQVRYRIKSSQEIIAIKTFGKSFSDSRMVLIVKENSFDFPRFAVIASKSVGGAVQRNRCKRRLRARAMQYLPKINTGADLLFVSRKALLTATPSEVDQSFEKLLSRANLLQA